MTNRIDGGRTSAEPRLTSGSGFREAQRAKGEKLLSRVKDIVHEGNVRRITVKNEAGRTILEAPLSLGVVGAALAPLWAALGTVAALVAKCSIEVHRAT
jgi:hypothetical protein